MHANFTYPPHYYSHILFRDPQSYQVGGEYLQHYLIQTIDNITHVPRITLTSSLFFIIFRQHSPSPTLSGKTMPYSRPHYTDTGRASRGRSGQSGSRIRDPLARNRELCRLSQSASVRAGYDYSQDRATVSPSTPDCQRFRTRPPKHLQAYCAGQGALYTRDP